MSSFREFIRRYEVMIALIFIVLNNAIFVGGIASEILPFKLYYLGRFLLLGASLGIVILIGSGWKGIIDLLRPMTKWRIAPWWYLLAFIWPALISVMVLTGKGMILGTGFSEIKVDFSVVSHPAVLKTIFVGSFVGEIVWVSYAVRHFSNKLTPFIGSQIVGFVWTLWWMPMVILNIGVFPDLPPLGLLFSMLGIAAMCSFIYFHTKSGLAVLTLQIMVNSTSLIFPVLPDSGGVPTFVANAGVYYAGVLLLYFFFGPKPILAVQKLSPEKSALRP